MNHSSDDVEVLTRVLSWLEAGQQVALVTVVQTWGSSPRPPGSLMAMNNTGKYVGSVSGGCVEEELIGRFQHKQFNTANPVLINYGVEPEHASQQGLPCGGQIKLLVEVLSDPASVHPLLKKLEQGELIARKVSTRSAEVELFPGQADKEIKHSETEVIKTFGPAWQLLIIGNGQIAGHLAKMALQLDYRVVVCDPRDVYEADEAIADVQYSKQMPDDAIAVMTNKKRLAVVALAHDPRQDDLALTAALESEAFYIGALGSKRSAMKRLERLQLLGYSSQKLERIHGPVGLDIGSKRPAEIALSILAHMSAVRNGMA